MYEGLGSLHQGMRNGGSSTREKGTGLKEESLGERGVWDTEWGKSGAVRGCTEGVHRGLGLHALTNRAPHIPRTPLSQDNQPGGTGPLLTPGLLPQHRRHCPAWTSKQLLCDRSHRLVRRVLVCDCHDTTATLIPQGQSCLSMPVREAKSTMAGTRTYFASGIQKEAHSAF